MAFFFLNYKIMLEIDVHTYQSLTEKLALHETSAKFV